MRYLQHLVIGFLATLLCLSVSAQSLDPWDDPWCDESNPENECGLNYYGDSNWVAVYPQVDPSVAVVNGQMTAAEFNQEASFIDIQLPGTWTYFSEVPNGKGFKVNGSEYNIFNNNNSPATNELGSTFNQVIDSYGNVYVYAGFFKIDQQISPRIVSTHFKGGGKKELSYDDRGNVELIEITGTDDTSVISMEKGFDSTCTNILTCNQPNWVKDAKGNQTDFVYSPVHGGVLSKTSPAADTSGVRPQTRYTYDQFEARYKNASGQIVASGQPIWLLTEETYCISSAYSSNQCANGASDEVIIAYDYGPTTGANNLALRGQTVTAWSDQDNSIQTHRTCFYYDEFGNRIGETAPNAGLTSCY